MELLALRNGQCSATEIQRYLSRIDDNDYNIGIDDDDVKNEIISDGMMTEIGYRAKSCPDGYPFYTDQTGSVLYVRNNAEPTKALLYQYLLFATRFRMNEQKVQGGLDGTLLLEELGAVILRSYLGLKSQTMVFGTAQPGKFSEKVGRLCHLLMEGGSFENIDVGMVHANDDGLDVVGWIPFEDKLPAKLCIFAQCKTGTGWHDGVHRLDPAAFVKRWMSASIVVDPVKALFIAESADRSQWKGVCVYGGILFDRCRIVDLGDSINDELIDQIRRWKAAAFEKLSTWNWD